jgi:putative acetyltransferase
MINLVRTNTENAGFISLVELLDKELLHEYGELQNFYGQFNATGNIKHVVVAYLNQTPVGCGAIKKYDDDTAEVKRMFVKNDVRGQGIAAKILEQLELWANELGFSYCILETGDRQQSAVALYKKGGYQVVPNYGQYIGIETSICMKKQLGLGGDLPDRLSL